MGRPRKSPEGDANGNGQNGSESKLFAGDVETPYQIDFTIRGTKSFFFNRFDPSEFERKSSAKPGSRIRREHDPEKLVWRNEDGELAVPGDQVLKALAAAGRFVKDPTGTGRKSSRPFIFEAFAISPELCSLGTAEWDCVDVRAVRLKNGATVPKERPIFRPGWETNFTVEVLMPDLVAPADVAKLVQLAGQVRGLGDAYTLGFGRFVPTEVSVPRDLAWA